MAKIKKGDLVQVIAGRDKGLQGRVLAVDTAKDRVIVEGVQRVKKHTRVGRTDRGAVTGGIETVEAPIHVSNVMLVGPDKKPVRVGFREVEVERNGRKKIMRERVGRRGGKEIEL
ncbi:50S ribosomal protein L24 [Trueperella bialowiezensis]|uniref:Large ribosomal subunit protein uL24 n=1 Tax=Trueperella bialowiezensis TaxID=312285 RepID=A0A3S4VSM3_9ACTO|nr:50S ribosomal protein L24 [Trueperella bialowiezensis]VEI12839.1 50S ribosomal protein L24 [Trueperella bialowiezensis]